MKAVLRAAPFLGAFVLLGWFGADAEVFVGQTGAGRVTVHADAATGDVAPIRVLSGLSNVRGVFVSLEHDELYVVERDSNRVRVFARTAEGAATPLRTIAGASTGLSNPQGIVLTREDELLVANEGGDSISVFSRLADGDTAPVRVITGSATMMDSPAPVASTLAAGGAAGFVAPLPLFADGFEDGGLSAWSASVP